MQNKHALVTVTDKTDLEKLLPLQRAGWKFISTGGTAKKLRELGFDIMEVSNFTGMPEMMDGRLKTLHPKVHGGILAVRSDPEHMKQLERMLDSQPIDLVVVNLYDFAGEPSIENIDIGGPALIRAAAKNYESVTVVVDRKDYDRVVDEILNHNRGSTSHALREDLARKAFGQTAAYDARIGLWFENQAKKRMRDAV